MTAGFSNGFEQFYKPGTNGEITLQQVFHVPDSCWTFQERSDALKIVQCLIKYKWRG